MNWQVIVEYDPGTPKVYYVRDAPSAQDAKDRVLLEIGYNPGVLIRVKLWTLVRSALQWQPLTQSQKDMIQYND